MTDDLPEAQEPQATETSTLRDLEIEVVARAWHIVGGAPKKIAAATRLPPKTVADVLKDATFRERLSGFQANGEAVDATSLNYWRRVLPIMQEAVQTAEGEVADAAGLLRLTVASFQRRLAKAKKIAATPPSTDTLPLPEPIPVAPVRGPTFDVDKVMAVFTKTLEKCLAEAQLEAAKKRAGKTDKTDMNEPSK